MHAAGRRGLAGALLALLAGVAWYGWAASRPTTEPAATPTAATLVVRIARAEQRAMPRVLEAVGKVLPSSSAEVRPQASGLLREVYIHDGDTVAAGQPLFSIDPQPLRASWAQARAQWSRDQALADDAAQAEQRLRPLAAKEYVSAKELESAVHATAALRAAAEGSRAQVEQARIALGYTTVRAPIAGRAGAVLVKPGNVLAAGTSALVVINQASPAEVAFALPQRALSALREAQALSAPALGLTVEARDSASGRLRARGRLVFIDNADEALWPGEFCTVRIVLGVDAAAVTVPEAALQQGQHGPYVFAVQEGVARLRAVTLARRLDGRAVIAEGLQGEERVVLAAPSRLRDGMTVQAAVDVLATAPAGVPPAAADAVAGIALQSAAGAQR